MRGFKRVSLVVVCLLPVMFLVMTLAPNLAHADESAALEGKLSDKIPRPEDSPNAAKKDLFKASVSSLYLDLTGTRPAADGSYSFGQVGLTVESLNLENEFMTGTKAYLRAQYLTNEYALMAGGKTYDETTSGMGDTLVGLNHVVVSTKGGFTLLGDLGGYLPTGSIDQVNPYMATTNFHHYKYFMQLGSGTFDETAGITALYKQAYYQLGSSLKTIIRDYNNDNGYRLGNMYAANAWLDVPLKYGFTPRLTGVYREKTAMHGQDPEIVRSAAEFYYHDQIDWNVSLGLRYTYKIAKSASLVAEVGAPVLQGMKNSDDVNLDTNFYGTVSAAGTF